MESIDRWMMSESVSTGTHNESASSSNTWTMCAVDHFEGANNVPYLDVQTVKHNLTIDDAAALEDQSHCRLLVEPVLVPDLGHTGVVKESIPGDSPLFYPNGCKNCNFGATVRGALGQVTRSIAGCQSAECISTSCCSFSSSSGHTGIDAWKRSGMGHQKRTAAARRERIVKGLGSQSRGCNTDVTLAHNSQDLEDSGGGSQRQQRKCQKWRYSGDRSYDQQSVRPLDFAAEGGGEGSSSSVISSYGGGDGNGNGWRSNQSDMNEQYRKGDEAWVFGRKAADIETKELLGALKENSSKLDFLVGIT